MSSTQPCPALLIAAPASGQGKTTLVAGLARYYRQQGQQVRVFKTGPDFIDPTILERASGHPVYQLDLWMVGDQRCRQLLYEASLQADLILIEGVMGLFDGNPSSADLAQTFGLPVMLVIDASAMAQTFGAVALGLADYRGTLTIAGVVANRVASPGHATMLQQSLPVSTPWLGAVMADPQIALPERHLGLHLADEVDSLDQKIDSAAQQIALTELANITLSPVDFEPVNTVLTPKLLPGVRIAIARDAAFCFVYPDNLLLLEQLGAKLSYFSPLNDTGFGDVDALYLPGGYPELLLDPLADNQQMLDAISRFHQSNRPIVAECGGMLYLLKRLADRDGHHRQLAGLIDATATLQPRLAGIGMQGHEFPQGPIHGHTFHYASFDSAPQFSAQASLAKSGSPGEGIIRQGGLTASFIHWYLPSNPAASAALFLPQLAHTEPFINDTNQ